MQSVHVMKLPMPMFPNHSLADSILHKTRGGIKRNCVIMVSKLAIEKKDQLMLGNMKIEGTRK